MSQRLNKQFKCFIKLISNAVMVALQTFELKYLDSINLSVPVINNLLMNSLPGVSVCGLFVS